MSTTLILGCGYLGRRVARRLLARGERVLGTTRSQAKAAELAALGVEPVRYEVLEGGPLPPAGRVVACVGFDRSAGVPIEQVYVGGLALALDGLPDVRQVVYAGSTGVYGGSRGGWVDELDTPDPPGESGRAVWMAERLLAARSVGRPLAATSLRLAGLYGPGRIIRREPLRRGEPIAGDPEKWINLVHIDDAAAAVVAALDRPGPEGSLRAINVVDDRPVTRRELYGLAARLLGAPEPRFVPAAGDEPDKRVANRRMREVLGVSPAFPDIATGLPAALAAEAEAEGA